MKQPIILKATIDGIRTMKDRSLKITIVSQELKPEHSSLLLSLQNCLCDVLINDKEISESEMQLLRDNKWSIEDVPGMKSPSQRLRAVMYKLWQQGDGGYRDFELFYANRMEQLIEHYKGKLS